MYLKTEEIKAIAHSTLQKMQCYNLPKYCMNFCKLIFFAIAKRCCIKNINVCFFVVLKDKCPRDKSIRD